MTNCKCRQSRCLKLYCECYSEGSICNISCKCTNCKNNNPIKAKRAFEKKKRKPNFCTCKNTRCLKKYCICFRNGTKCSIYCKCEDCDNSSSLKRPRKQSHKKKESLIPMLEQPEIKEFDLELTIPDLELTIPDSFKKPKIYIPNIEQRKKSFDETNQSSKSFDVNQFFSSELIPRSPISPDTHRYLSNFKITHTTFSNIKRIGKLM